MNMRHKIDESGNIIANKKGKPVADTSKRDTENVPLNEDIEVYMEREVIPYNEGAWCDLSKTKIGYEIQFTKTFYEFKELEPSAEIASRIENHEQMLISALKELFG